MSDDIRAELAILTKETTNNCAVLAILMGIGIALVILGGFFVEHHIVQLRHEVALLIKAREPSSSPWAVRVVAHPTDPKCIVFDGITVCGK
jgi:hypothetical protein